MEVSPGYPEIHFPISEVRQNHVTQPSQGVRRGSYVRSLLVKEVKASQFLACPYEREGRLMGPVVHP